MPLSGKQRRYLRARGHELAAIVQMGKEGLSPALVQAVDDALDQHELIKIRIGQGALIEGKRDRRAAAEDLARQTKSEVAQVLGNTLLLYRRHPEEPEIELP
ncbi:ribosome assembly RNA-binding protein YhbY [Haliangium sp.]|uniref:ribosome assembly RNA-binding protein YhbY n=1 Tax=Haliangium sp. TaxID=2663208 RepID=UPI003D12BA01